MTIFGIQISQTNLDSRCTFLSDPSLLSRDQFGAGSVAKSTSNVVITFLLIPPFPSQVTIFVSCTRALHGDLFFLSLDEPGVILVRSYGCTFASP